MNEHSPDDEARRFLEFIEKHKGLIYKIAGSYSRDEQDRRDLIQEITIQLWRSRKRYDDRFASTTWGYRIALNVSISVYRKANRHSGKFFPMIEEPAATKDESNVDRHDIDRLRSLISELNDLDRALILMSLDERPHKEIADVLGISTSNVATKLNRIKAKLKTQFKKEQNR